MDWTPDDEDIPITIPKNLQALEKLGRETLNAMTKQEIEDRLQEIAETAATNCKKEIPHCSFEKCVSVVSTVIERAGSDIEGSVGATMVAESKAWAKAGCESAFNIEL